MKRYLCWLALLGVAALPDWASAFYPFRPCWAPPPPCQPFGYGGPVFPRLRPFAPSVVPDCEVPVSPPAVHVFPVTVVPVSPAPAPATATRPTPPTPTKPPTVTVEPSPAPTSVKPPESDPMFKPAVGATDKPPAPLPPPLVPESKGSPAPPLVLPPIPGMADPKPMTPANPAAAPAPAPPPAAGDTAPVIPLPGLPEPKKPKASTSDDTLPPLVLPPEGGAAPSGVVPPISSTSKSSPLSGGVQARVFTTAGTPAGGLTRKVGFFNHTGRAISLVIEGRTTTLPAKTFIHAEVPPSFRWGYVDRDTQTATVPDGAAGLDVLFSE